MARASQKAGNPGRAVSDFQTYLNEYSFRYNHRASGNLIFPLILDRASRPELLKPSEPAKRNLPV